MADFLNLRAVMSIANSGFIQGLRQAENQVKAFAENTKRQFAGSFQGGQAAGGVVAAGGFLGRILGIGSAIIGLRKASDEIDKFQRKLKEIRGESQKTGLGVEDVQRVMNIGDINKTGNAMEKIAEAQAAILGGDDKELKLAKAFQQLGVSLDDLKKKNHQQIFFQLAAAMKDAEASAANLNALSAVMGGKADDLLPMFRKGLDSAEANAGVMAESDLREFEAREAAFSRESAFAADTLKGMWKEAVGLWQKFKLGALEAGKFPSTVLSGPEDLASGLGTSRRKQGALRVAERDRLRAAAQIEAEEKRIAGDKAAKEEAERREKLEKKIADFKARRETDNIRTHIGRLTGLQDLVGADISKLQAPDARMMSAWQRGGEGARVGFARGEGREIKRLLDFNQRIVHELQRANQALNAINNKQPQPE